MYVYMFPLSLRVSASVQYLLWPFRVCTISISILVCLFEVWLIVYIANLRILFHVLFAIIYPITHLKPNIAPEKCLKHDDWNTYFPFEIVCFSGDISVLFMPPLEYPGRTWMLQGLVLATWKCICHAPPPNKNGPVCFGTSVFTVFLRVFGTWNLDEFGRFVEFGYLGYNWHRVRTKKKTWTGSKKSRPKRYTPWN